MPIFRQGNRLPLSETEKTMNLKNLLIDVLMVIAFGILIAGQFIIGELYLGTTFIVIHFLLQLGVLTWIIADETSE